MGLKCSYFLPVFDFDKRSFYFFHNYWSFMFCNCRIALFQDIRSRTTPHTNQINALQVQQVAQNGEMAIAVRQRKTAVATLFVYVVFLACYLPLSSIYITCLCLITMNICHGGICYFTLWHWRFSVHPWILDLRLENETCSPGCYGHTSKYHFTMPSLMGQWERQTTVYVNRENSCRVAQKSFLFILKKYFFTPTGRAWHLLFL